MLEGHPLSARFLGSHPLVTKAPGRPESQDGGVGGGGAFTKSHVPPLSLEALTPPWQQLEPAIIPSSAI